MFEIGFGELVLLGVIALLVLGPERLPEVAATIGRLLGQLQKWWAVTKIQMEQELHLHALKNKPELNVPPEIKNILENSVMSIEKNKHKVVHGTNAN